METRLERVGDLKVVKQSSMGYILENGVEIVDTFAEMFPVMEMPPANSLFSFLARALWMPFLARALFLLSPCIRRLGKLY
jgi:hypothetical protein